MVRHRFIALSAGSSYGHSCFYPSQHRWISAMSHLESATWVNKIKSVFTGKKPEDGPSSQATATSSDSEAFTLLRFANEMSKARKMGTLGQYVVGRSSVATFADAFQKQEAILRCLGGFDPSGDNIQTSHKQEAAKKCNCTVSDVEHTLARFTWAKQAHIKVEKLKEEGKPMPKSLGEVQKLMGSTPMDLARSNMAKSGQISRNAMCPCGSKKRYKRCCGKD